jgi:hypothetical protein
MNSMLLGVEYCHPSQYSNAAVCYCTADKLYRPSLSVLGCGPPWQAFSLVWMHAVKSRTRNGANQQRFEQKTRGFKNGLCYVTTLGMAESSLLPLQFDRPSYCCNILQGMLADGGNRPLRVALIFESEDVQLSMQRSTGETEMFLLEEVRFSRVLRKL